MLLLIDDDQSEILEFDVLAEKRMGADDDVHRAVGYPLLHFREFARGDEPRGLREMHRVAAQAFAESLKMLAGEQRSRHHDRDLLAVHRGDESGAQRDLGFSESHIATDKPRSEERRV